MELSAQEWGIVFNTIFFGLAICFGLFVIFMYKKWQPIYYGYLMWSLVLMLFAAFLFGLYTLSINQIGMINNYESLKQNLLHNLSILIFVVPGVMLAVSANLLTEFLKLKKPNV